MNPDFQIRWTIGILFTQFSRFPISDCCFSSTSCHIGIPEFHVGFPEFHIRIPKYIYWNSSIPNMKSEFQKSNFRILEMWIWLSGNPMGWKTNLRIRKPVRLPLLGFRISAGLLMHLGLSMVDVQILNLTHIIVCHGFATPTLFEASWFSAMFFSMVNIRGSPYTKRISVHDRARRFWESVHGDYVRQNAEKCERKNTGRGVPLQPFTDGRVADGPGWQRSNKISFSLKRLWFTTGYTN